MFFHCRQHGWRATHQNLSGSGGCGEVSLNLVLGNEAHATGPYRRGIVEDVKQLEAAAVRAGKGIELLPHQDVLLVDVGVDEADGGTVGGVFEDGAEDLVHWGNAAAARDHANGRGEPGGVGERASWTLYA